MQRDDEPREGEDGEEQPDGQPRDREDEEGDGTPEVAGHRDPPCGKPIDEAAGDEALISAGANPSANESDAYSGEAVRAKTSAESARVPTTVPPIETACAARSPRNSPTASTSR